MATYTRPSVVVLAGPNGAGKSTVAPALLQGALGIDEFVNADVIARGLSAFDPESAAIAAGRVMLARLHELAEQRVSFAFETTLASRSFALWLRRLRVSDTTSTSSSCGCLRQTWPSRVWLIEWRWVGIMCGTKLFGVDISPAFATSFACTSRFRQHGRCTTTLALDLSMSPKAWRPRR